MAVKVFEVLSVAMTSSPEVVGTEKISSTLGFQDPLNSVLNSVLSNGLRAFASLGRIDALTKLQTNVMSLHYIGRPVSYGPYEIAFHKNSVGKSDYK